MKNRYPLVSVYMITYNHEKFISKALDSVLMQKVNFEYEIVVGEDCSKDNTRKILLEYFEKYPDLFKLVLQKSNLGFVQNSFDTFINCRGKYIAVLEGDDYWTDELKLQNQVNFLEANPDFGLVYNDICLVDQNENKLPDRIQNSYRPKEIFEGDIFFTLLKKGNFIYNSTSLFRNDIISECLKNEKYENVQDIYLWLVISSRSKVKYFNTIAGAYRRHQGNLSSDPHTIVGRKTWEYSIVKGIKYGIKNKQLKINKENYLYILKLLILKILNSKYFYLKYLSGKLIILVILKYYYMKFKDRKLQ